MDKVEARKVLVEFIEAVQKKHYSELLQLLNNPVCIRVEDSSGAQYQIEYEAL